jgi:intein/homing endonuclease
MAWLSGYSHRRKITIDNTKVDSTLTDFPVLVKLTSANFDFSQANSDGFDVRFCSNDGETLLKYERERHDSANELAEYWVKVPSVSDSADTYIYLYYRTEDTADGADPENVWDSNYKAVHHLKDATTSTVLDSTSNNNDGTKKGCLPAGTYIKTDSGFKDIIDIKVGDRVFTYTENGVSIQKVKRVIDSGKKQIYELKTKNRSIKASGNHPLLTVEYINQQRVSGYNKEKKHPYSYNKNNYKLVWKRLDKIKRGDVIVAYSGSITRGEPAKVSTDLLKLLGCFLGDGSNTTRKNRKQGGRIYYHLYNKELIKKYSVLLTNEGIHHTKNNKLITICQNESYYKLCNLGFVSNAHNKVIPEWVFSLSKEYKDSLLEGFIDSDGYKIKFGYGIGLCNRKMINQIRNICIDLGYRVGNIRFKKAKAGGMINGRVINGGDSYVLNFYPNSNKDNSELRYKRNKRINHSLPPEFQYQTVSSIKTLDIKETYDIEIENSHNFIADGIVVHNSNEPVEAAGQIYKAQDFDGVNDYIDVGSIDSVNGISKMTISGWVKRNSGFGALFYKQSIDINSWIEVVWHSSLGLLFVPNGGVNFAYLSIPSGDDWKSFDFVFDGTQEGNENRAKIYVNGSLQSTNYEGTIANVTASPGGTAKIGRDLWNEVTIDGIIDEVRISNVARSAAWIKASYNSGNNSLLSIGADDEPSASVSPSFSPSISESSSISASLSESISPSLSESVSSSISPSISESSSISASISPSLSASISISISPSLSPSSSPSIGYQEYTKGDYVELPAGADDLTSSYTEQNYIDVSSINDVFVGQDTSYNYTIHQFKEYCGNSDICTLTCVCKTNFLPSLSPVYLQIYNRDTSSWETVATNNTANVNTSFTLSANIFGLSDYKDENTVIACRVYQLG